MIRSRQFLVFLSVGIATAAIDIGLMQWLLWQGATPWLAASIAFAICVTINYAAHAKLTFDAPSSLRSFTRFLTIVAVNYLITIACVQASQSLMGMPLIGKIASYPLVTLNGFLFSKHWIYR